MPEGYRPSRPSPRTSTTTPYSPTTLATYHDGFPVISSRYARLRHHLRGYRQTQQTGFLYSLFQDYRGKGYGSPIHSEYLSYPWRTGIYRIGSWTPVHLELLGRILSNSRYSTQIIDSFSPRNRRLNRNHELVPHLAVTAFYELLLGQLVRTPTNNGLRSTHATI